MKDNQIIDQKETQLYTLFDEVGNMLSNSPMEWQRFLAFAGDVYKYSFDNAILTYAQVPKVTALASEKVWRSIGREVIDDAKAVVVTNFNGDQAFQLHHLYDMTQTVGKEVSMQQWSFDALGYEALARELNPEKINGDMFDRLRLGIMQSVRSVYSNPEPIFEQLVRNSAYYLIQQRLGIPEKMLVGNEDEQDRVRQAFTGLSEIKNLTQFSGMGNAVFNAARPFLKQMEIWKQSYDVERVKENDNRGYKGKDSIQENGEWEKYSEHRKRESENTSKSGRVQQSKDAIPGGNESRRIPAPDAIQQSSGVLGESGRNGRDDDDSIRGRMDSQTTNAGNSGSVTKNSVLQRDKGSREGTSDEGIHSAKQQRAIKPKKEVLAKRAEASFFDDEQLDLFDLSLGDSESVMEVALTPNQPASPPSQKGRNYYRDKENNYPIGPVKKCQANIVAIRLLRLLQEEQRLPTSDEQISLAKYTGWGGLQEAFDPRSSKLAEEYEILKALLSDEEYKAARSSVLTAFYTEPFVVEEIYHELEKQNSNIKTILDPAMGTGNFFSKLPKNMRDLSLTGIELDPITGQIAQYLYPEATIHVKGFEEVELKAQSFDAIVGNIPFNSFKISDKRGNYFIHDYFIQKSMELVKPGGIIAFISSSGTLDKADVTHRLKLSRQLDLIQAVRLPVNVFQRLGGISVTTDLLFFRKRMEPRPQLDKPTWIESTEVMPRVRRNNYFMENPEKVLGNIRVKNFRGSTEEVFSPDYTTKSFQRLLHDSLQGSGVQQDVQLATTKKIAEAPSENVDSLEEKNVSQNEVVIRDTIKRFDERRYTYQLIDGTIYYVNNDELVRQTFSGQKEARIKGMIAIRDALLPVIDIQALPFEEADLVRLQRKLITAYDTFVDTYGAINEKANRAAFQLDDQLPLLRSIEDFDKETNTYKKAPVFTEATIRPFEEIKEVQTAEDAAIYSLNQVGEIDIATMQLVYQESEERIFEELGTKVFYAPDSDTLVSSDFGKDTQIAGKWVMRDEYLTGDVKSKLAVARHIASIDPVKFGRNVDALEAVQPKDLLPSEIQFSIGSTWIPLQEYQNFMYECLETSYAKREGFNAIAIHYSGVTTKWHISGKGREPNSIKANNTFGTRRKNGYEILEDCLNLQSTTVFDPSDELDAKGKPKYVVNAKETMIARGKQQQIQEAFTTWLFSDRDRTVRLVKLYNDRFNRIVPRKYDGSYLAFPNMSRELTLRKHQENVVARIAQSKTALMAHEVGAGKTAAMIAAGMYLKQIGTVQKPMFVVPNHLVDQWGMEFLRFFPKANILVTGKKDFEKENRKTFVSRIATGKYDAVIIGQSQFERIPLSITLQTNFIQSQIDHIHNEIQREKDAQGERWTIKQMEINRKGLETQLKKLNNAAKKDNLIDFEKLGVDFLFVDEAHHYKNCMVFSKMQGISGISQSSSQRAMDMLMKCQYMQSIQDEGGVVFATGTPISNSMAEMFVMQRYLQPTALEKMNISGFDEWASTFGEVVSSLEITPEGTGYKMKSRFAKFHNLPELMNVFSEVADIQTSDMLQLPVPEIAGGRAEIIATEATPHQEAVMESFVQRSEKIRNGSVNASEDNMLKLTHEAKLLAIDPRLLDYQAPNHEDSKLNVCARNVYRIWEEQQAQRSTQMIFCDSGTPKKGQFNVYDEMKSTLMEKGIPENEIAFIHDAKTDIQRDTLFRKVREGEVRVLLGSTAKVGTGTNVQNKLIAGHHIDCPWRPSDIIQRDGRVIRQGNENDVVHMYRYVTKSTFDAYLWQIQEQKLSYISQVMTGKSISRDCADLDETVLTAAEVKAVATSNPLLAEKMTLDNEIGRLRLLKGEWQNGKNRLHEDIESRFPAQRKAMELSLDYETADVTLAEKSAGNPFKMELGGALLESRKEASEVLETIVFNTDLEVGMSKKIGTLRDFEVHVTKNGFHKHLRLIGAKAYDTTFSSENGIGNIIKLENVLKGIPEQRKKTKVGLEQLHKEWEDAKEEVMKPFVHDEKLTSLLQRQQELNYKLEFKDIEGKNAAAGQIK